MTENEKRLRGKRIRLAAAEMRYQKACSMPAVPGRHLTVMRIEIERMKTDLDDAIRDSKRREEYT